MDSTNGRPVTQIDIPGVGNPSYHGNDSGLPNKVTSSVRHNGPASVPQKRRRSLVDNIGDTGRTSRRKRTELKAPEIEQTRNSPAGNITEADAEGNQAQYEEGIPAPSKADIHQTRDDETRKRKQFNIERDSAQYDKEFRAVRSGIRQKKKGTRKRRYSGIESDYAGYESDKYVRAVKPGIRQKTKGHRKRRQSDIESDYVEYESDKYARAVKPGVGQSFPLRKQSPWEAYEDGYEFNIGGSVTVTMRKLPVSEKNQLKKQRKVVIRELLGPDRDAAFSMLCLLQGEYFIRSTEAYAFENRLYIVSEHMPVALDQLIKVPIYPSEFLVASIIKQICAGVQFLESRGMCHGSINCSTVLANSKGDVKIGFQERCGAIDKREAGHKDVKALGDVMSQIMKRPSTGIRSSGNTNLYPWSTKAKDFLSKTAFASAIDLIEHEFLKRVGSKNKLSLFVGLGKISSRRSYAVEWYPD